jgi:hypothetical protein
MKEIAMSTVLLRVRRGGPARAFALIFWQLLQ